MNDPGEPWRGRRGGWGHRGPPAWWPADEAWPPPRGAWARSRGRTGFWYPVGCLIFVFVLFLAGMIAVGVWAVAALVGMVPAPRFGLPVGIVVLLVIVFVVARLAGGLRRLGRPIDQLSQAAERVEAGDYSARVTETGPQPVRRLARAFNTMSARLDESDRQRRSFLADVSHELRTPLTVIQGQLEAIADGVYPADEAHLRPVLAQARVLERLIADLRTVALADAGTLQLDRQPTDLGGLVGEVVAGFRASADARGVQLGTAIQPGLPLVPLDAGRMRQVLSNLIDNALRHTPADGRVAIALRREDPNAILEVRDTGTGIPPELLPRVFDRFAKAPGSEGSGLGLAIAKDLVEAHGGTMTAASTVGQGSIFRASLPLKGPAAQPPRA